MSGENRDEFHKKASGLLDNIRKWLAITGSVIGILLFARELIKKAEALLFVDDKPVQEAVREEDGAVSPVKVDPKASVNLAASIIKCETYLGKPVPDVFKRSNAVLYELEDRNIKGGISLIAEDKIVSMSALLSSHRSVYEARLWLSPFYNIFEELGWRLDESSVINEFTLYYKDGVYGCIFDPEETPAGSIIAYVSFTGDINTFFKYELLKYKARK
jgi:hypothetical protein